MKQYAISSKLLWISIVLFVVTVSTLSLTTWQALSTNNQQMASETQKALNDEIQEKLKAKASQYSERISAFINEAYRVPYSFSAIMGNTGGEGVSREQAQQLISETLLKNKQLSSFYT